MSGRAAGRRRQAHEGPCGGSALLAGDALLVAVALLAGVVESNGVLHGALRGLLPEGVLLRLTPALPLSPDQCLWVLVQFL
jgi:hypothetical protein